jgi:hypothetical protein
MPDDFTWEIWTSNVSKFLPPKELNDIWIALQWRRRWLKDEIGIGADWCPSEIRPSNRLIQIECILNRLRSGTLCVGDLSLWTDGAPDIVSVALDRIEREAARV